MAAFGLRPSVSDLVFQLYEKPVHPELFDVCLTRTIPCDDYSLTVRITRTGHALSWNSRWGHLTELADVTQTPLPTHRCLYQRRLRGEHSASHAWSPGLNYQTSFQVEVLPEEIFASVHEEILADGLKRGLLHNFRPHNRISLAPLSYVTTEAFAGGLVVATFHTFPDEFAIVKTQSLIDHRS